MGLFNTMSSNTISSGIIIAGNYLSTNKINMSTGQIVGLSTINGLAWPPIDDALWSGSITGDIWSDNSGNVGIGKNNPQYKLDVNGDIYASGNITAGSDLRFKININTIENALSTVNKLRGVSYTSIANQTRNIGVIAQEIEKILPEVVLTDNSENRFKSVAYGNIVGLLIEAINESVSSNRRIIYVYYCNRIKYIY
jgi:hypothetical protein